ncbi:hypothetical protein [Candidatus Neptunichlamydia sp. REUL1]|uniref:hypothetical protein n=1 Tax=Candidatus Neptunichlamydia sp. REUL1 TaxID=3064277 RepID=UPI00292F0722|nr:hypothetical protein [Candidatus Neptunochlamydia sp. REUL1]
MDGLIRFFGNGRSIAWDTYHLMRDPQERTQLGERVEEFINGFSPFRENASNSIPTLDKLQNVIDFTEYFTRHAAKAFLVFTVINAAVYHFTRLLTFIALTYFISTFVFCMIYLDTWEIAGASQDIKDILAKNARCECIEANQSSPLIRENKRREFNNLMSAVVTHNNVGLAIKRIERLSNGLILTNPIASFPLGQILKHLRVLEEDLHNKLFIEGRVLFE